MGGDVVDADDVGMFKHGPCIDRKRAEKTLIDRLVQNMANRALARCAEQDRETQRFQPGKVAHGLQALRGRLAETDARVEHQTGLFHPRLAGYFQSFVKEGEHILHDVD